jgi:hypothetical protein
MHLSTTLNTINFTVGATSTAPPFGWVGSAVDLWTQSTTVAQSDSVFVQGWAADPQGGAPVSRVSILINGIPVGDATLGLPRPDIASTYGYPAFLDSGWTFNTPAAGLAPGTYALTAVVYDALSLSTTLNTVHFTVATTSTGPPFGWFGSAVDGLTHSTTVSQSDNLVVTGWAVDPQDGAPVTRVAILIDGHPVGNATLGLHRPDIASTYNNPLYLNSGWTFSIPASGLLVGPHTVTVVAYDSLGLTVTFAPRVIDVQ